MQLLIPVSWLLSLKKPYNFYIEKNIEEALFSNKKNRVSSCSSIFPMKYLLTIFIFVSTISCVKVEVEENPLLFFWEEMDKKYVYFEEKKVDWDSIKIEIQFLVPNIEEELITGFEKMIYPLNDRHVSVNLGEDIYITSPSKEKYFHYNLLADLSRYGAKEIIDFDRIDCAQLDNRIVYIRLYSFKYYIPDFYSILKPYNYDNGLILDIRNNAGGKESVMLDLAANFITGKQTVFYKKNKNGYGHNDFTDYKAIEMEGINRFSGIDIVIITDYWTYSSANLFASLMQNCTSAILVGNNTGGGGANPTDGILPNGWNYSISQNPYFDSNHKSLELGVEPDYKIAFGEEEYQKYTKTQIHPQLEFAYHLLVNNEN
ncbi:S41 family peptidase [uncultured Draconibacterium sp.]|uniref:S41 family peptidase n=1 Tax=uncultured Draconibacterium sp. TaxID=1573823 RepID=UPI003216C640